MVAGVALDVVAELGLAVRVAAVAGFVVAVVAAFAEVTVAVTAAVISRLVASRLEPDHVTCGGLAGIQGQAQRVRAGAQSHGRLAAAVAGLVRQGLAVCAAELAVERSSAFGGDDVAPFHGDGDGEDVDVFCALKDATLRCADRQLAGVRSGVAVVVFDHDLFVGALRVAAIAGLKVAIVAGLTGFHLSVATDWVRVDRIDRIDLTVTGKVLLRFGWVGRRAAGSAQQNQKKTEVTHDAPLMMLTSLSPGGGRCFAAYDELRR